IRVGGVCRPQDKARLLRLSRREAGADALKLMPWTAWIVVLSLIFSVCSAAADVETKYSRFGEIMLTRDFQNGSTIKLDGKVLYQSGKMQHLNIVEIIATKNRDYIVISENLGGSGTPDAYSVISIGPGNFEKLFANLELKFYEGRVSRKPLGAGIRPLA